MSVSIREVPTITCKAPHTGRGPAGGEHKLRVQHALVAFETCEGKRPELAAAVDVHLTEGIGTRLENCTS